MSFERSDLNVRSRLHRFVGEGDFLDCYTVRLDRADASIDQIAQRIFIGLPLWARFSLSLRDLAVAPFGLKTTASLPTDNSFRERVCIGDAINFLPVRKVAADEMILGEDDRHLDFRISVFRDRQTREVSLATWVRPHNLLGRVYLRMILAGHILIVRSRLKALARHFAA